jgi:hypothetical protein
VRHLSSPEAFAGSNRSLGWQGWIQAAPLRLTRPLTEMTVGNAH